MKKGGKACPCRLPRRSSSPRRKQGDQREPPRRPGVGALIFSVWELHRASPAHVGPQVTTGEEWQLPGWGGGQRAPEGAGRSPPALPDPFSAHIEGWMVCD